MKDLNDRDRAIDYGQFGQQEIDWDKIAPNVPMINLSSVVWPVDKQYGPDHHKKVAVLATHIARREFDLPQKEIDALWCAAIFHDLRRDSKFGAEDPSHRYAGASYAKEILSGPDSIVRDQEQLIDRTCYLIANHGRWEDGGVTGAKRIKRVSDPTLMCLIDADSMDVVRIDPKSTRWAKLIQDTLKPDMMLTQYAKQMHNLKNWMNFRCNG